MTEQGAGEGPSGWRFMLRALGHHNYRLYFIGQGVSLVGTWLTRVATAWLVYRLSGSALLLGVVGFCGQIPTFLLAPVAGVLVDRWDRHRLLVVTQALAMLQSLALAVLASLLAMRVVRRPREHAPQHLLTELKEGFTYVFHSPPIRALLLLLAMVSLLGLPFAVLMPVMASEVLKGGPNTLGVLIIAVFLELPAVILGEAFLSFIGLGIGAPDASWGSMAQDGRDVFRVAPFVIVIPGLAIATLVLCANFVADGLRDALDPRTRET